MSIQNKKYQDTELHCAALSAACSLIVCLLTVVAGAAAFALFTRLGDLVNTVTFKMPLLVLLMIFGGAFAATTTTAQIVSEEQILRETIQRQAAGSAATEYAENAVFASDALARPVVLENVRDAEAVKIKTVAAPRRKQILKIEIRRLVVAESKDFAYEYSDFILSYEQPDKTPDGYTGSMLRVWHKINGEWLIDAAFARQNRRDENR